MQNCVTSFMVDPLTVTKNKQFLKIGKNRGYGGYKLRNYVLKFGNQELEDQVAFGLRQPAHFN